MQKCVRIGQSQTEETKQTVQIAQRMYTQSIIHTLASHLSFYCTTTRASDEGHSHALVRFPTLPLPNESRFLVDPDRNVVESPGDEPPPSVLDLLPGFVPRHDPKVQANPRPVCRVLGREMQAASSVEAEGSAEITLHGTPVLEAGRALGVESRGAEAAADGQPTAGRAKRGEREREGEGEGKVGKGWDGVVLALCGFGSKVVRNRVAVVVGWTTYTLTLLGWNPYAASQCTPIEKSPGRTTRTTGKD